MTILQLNPMIPVVVNLSDEWQSGYALAIIDYSQEHHLMFVVAMDDTGEVWTVENPKIRIQKNITVGR